MSRDDGASKPARLTFPYDAQPVLLTNVEQPVVDVALDGRCDVDAKKEHGRVPGPEDMRRC